ncbi:hypothetical protein TNCV_3569731 [Trichonephila clavipes]|nr:hypothetical protein TNCV_3569731 [Trichonephila clavipes]
MASLGHQSVPPTDLGQVNEEMASPGGRLLQWRPTSFSQGHLNFPNPEVGVGSGLRVLPGLFFFWAGKCRGDFGMHRE